MPSAVNSLSLALCGLDPTPAGLADCEAFSQRVSDLHDTLSPSAWPLQESLQRIERDVLGKVPLSYFLGTLGMPGMTVSSQRQCVAPVEL